MNINTYNQDKFSNEYLQAMEYFEQEKYHSAFNFLKKGALKKDINCYNNLAVLYENGLGTKQNLDLALLWYKRAWKYNASSGICSNIASLYVRKGNIRQAKFWWNKAIFIFRDGDAALDFAKFLIQNCKKNNYIKNKVILLLQLAIQYEYATEISKKEAKKIMFILNKSR